MKSTVLVLSSTVVVFASEPIAAQQQQQQPPQQQEQPPPAEVQGEVAAPVEILMEVVNNQVRCSPSRALFPAKDELDLRIVNRAARAILFLAPDFLRKAQVIRTDRPLDVDEGRFLVEGNETIRIVFRAPEAGEYGYACSQPAHPPTPESSGFIVVVDAGPQQ